MRDTPEILRLMVDQDRTSNDPAADLEEVVASHPTPVSNVFILELGKRSGETKTQLLHSHN